MVLSTSGGLGEAETAGVIMNVIPRDGGNTFSATVFASGANGAMQGSNYMYDLVTTKVGLVDELAQSSRNFGEQIENWHGVDFGVTARLRSGLTVQGGLSTGRTLTDSCAAKAKLPELGQRVGGADNSSIAGGSLVNPYCRVVEPFLTDVRGLATYTIPKVDIQVSGTWQSNPGPSLAANYVVSNAVIAAGRSRSAAISRGARTSP